MKKWLTPSAIQEDFMTDNAVSSCGSYNATTYCAIPGKDAYHVNDGSDWRVDSEYHWHKWQCSDPGTVDITAGKGHESGYFGNDIYDIKIGTQVSDLTAAVDSNIGSYNSSTFKVDGVYKASWKSNSGSTVYKHYGLVKVNSLTNFNPAHPLRS